LTSVRRMDFDQIVETSTLIAGEAQDTPAHDLFVVRAFRPCKSPDTMTVSELLEDLGDLGNVVDFGSGFNRKYCETIKVIEHVEWRAHRSLCTCGCGIVPFATPFYCHKTLKTFFAINSLQNNSYSFVQRLLAQVLDYGLDFVIVQPILSSDEFDCAHLIYQMFAGVKTLKLEMGQVAYVFQRQRYDIEKLETSVSTVEVCVNVGGEPVSRDSDEIKQSVLIFGLDSDHNVYVVDKGDNGTVDFHVAGHLQFGEMPIEAAVREWKEEMKSPVPVFEYYGMLEPPASMARAFVYVAFLNILKLRCAKDRGKIRLLKSNDVCRNDFYPAIRAISTYFDMTCSKFNLSQLLSVRYDSMAQEIAKRKYYDKFNEDPEFLKLSSGQKWNYVFSLYKKEYNHFARVQAVDLRTKFHLDLRTTNQSAIVHTPVVPGMIVILNVDTHTPCPIVSLVYKGRRVGYSIYVRTQSSKRLYRVVECNTLAFQPSDNVAINCTFNVPSHDTYFTDNECGATLLSSYLGCTFDEALAMIRSNLGYMRLQPDVENTF